MLEKRAGFLVCSLVIIHVCAGAIDAQRGSRAMREVLFQSWLEAVNEHEPGNTDAALNRARNWSDAQLGVLNDALISVFSSKGQSLIDGPGERQRVLRRGAVLHADLAMLAGYNAAPQTGPLRSSSGRPSLVVDDGHASRFAGISRHWEIGRLLVEYLSKAQPGDFGALWYRATAEFLISNADYAAVEPHLARARQLFPADANIWMASGAVRASFASPAVQHARLTARIQSGSQLLIDDQRNELNRAHGYLRRAVALDPANAEAQLRYGWVLVLQQRWMTGLAALRQAQALATEPVLQYYASLFLGAAESGNGDEDRARFSFERAKALYPDAQSPLLGLSELAMRHGRIASARESLERVFVLPDQPTRDPWLEYDISCGRNWQVSLSRLYDALREPPR